MADEFFLAKQKERRKRKETKTTRRKGKMLSSLVKKK